MLMLGCAVQAPPSGGPVDRTPPEIVNTSLLPGTVNVPENLHEIQITFSERMKEGSERNNVFVSPPLQFSIGWKKGRIMTLQLNEQLKSEQTYVFTLGSGLQDLRNNKMAQSFILAFSTGDSIDQGQITGKVYGLKPNETFNIFAYAISDSNLFNPFKIKPDYISQTGEDGSFSLGFLRHGCYRLLAVEDRNHNLVLDAIVEHFAIGYQDVCLDTSKNTFSGMGLRLAHFDTLPPQVISVRALFNDLLRVRFSEPVVLDSSFYFFVKDSLSGQQLPSSNYGKNPENANWLEILTGPLDSAKTYMLQFSQFKDSSGNVQDENLTYYFHGSAKRDTTRFRIINFTPEDSAQKVRPESKIYFRFSLPVNWPEFQQNFKLTLASGKAVEGHWQSYSLYDGSFVPKSLLKPDSQYIAQLNLSQIHDFRGQRLVDSLNSFTFFIVSNKELGEVSGTINFTPRGFPVILKLNALHGKKITLTTQLQNSNQFYFPFVPEGEYQLQGFVDKNKNGRFDNGWLTPFHFCEPFTFSEDTIRVRKRWETSGIKFNLPVTEEEQ